MSYSLNEVEMTAKKAARGAGYPWGMSEEAGKATRWLCQQDIDGCAILAGLLEQTDHANLTDWSPAPGSYDWNANGNQLCPILTGASVSDHGEGLCTRAVKISNVVQPLLLLPFVAMAARQIGATLTLKWSGFAARTDGNGLSIRGDHFDLADLVSVEICGAHDATQTVVSRANPDPVVWAVLSQFAHRTYAPATDESRAKGAGAGVTDND